MLPKKEAMHPKAQLEGKIFGHLTVLAEVPKIKREKRFGNNVQWNCKCSCGKYRVVTTSMLTKGISKSCGCQNFIGIVHGNRKYEQELSDYRAKAASIKAGARHRKIKFDLTLEHAAKLVSENCHYCGSEPNEIFRNTKTNGIDRVDSDNGYIKNNVVPCCKYCNFAKNNSSKEDFLDWIKRLVIFNS